MKAEILYHIIGRLGWLYDLGFTMTGYTRAIHSFITIFTKEAHGNIRSVLDAGCGTGQYAVALLQHLPQANIVAFDLEKSMVEYTRKRLKEAGLLHRARLFAADITGPLPEIHEQFDAIIISGVFEYTSPHATVKNLSRFLKKGGLVLHSPVRDTAWARFVGKLYHFVPHSQETLIDAFTSQGFKLRRLIVQKPFLLPAFKEAHIFEKVA